MDKTKGKCEVSTKIARLNTIRQFVYMVFGHFVYRDAQKRHNLYNVSDHSPKSSNKVMNE
jgi:hypothetical protein